MTLPREGFAALLDALRAQVLGQEALTSRLLVALLSDGHVLVEGVPGLAKTRAVKTLAELLRADFQRIQFTADLLPADLTGTDIFRPEEGTFEFRKGPLFNHLILADEINRAPAKVQSAVLEAMEERQITVGTETYPLPPLYLVMATQNPLDQDGTFALPEAQLDRFLLHVQVDYPSAATEHQILALAEREARALLDSPQADGGAQFEPVHETDVREARKAVLEVHLAPQLENYVVELVLATRTPQAYDAELAPLIHLGASPRATIGLVRAARAHAWLAGRDYVSPADIQTMAPDVLRHRLVMSYEARAGRSVADDVIKRLLERVPVP
ncbi:MAG: MoxR family ATPase [Pseudomonadota bacterium]